MMLDNCSEQQPMKETMIISVRQSVNIFFKLDFALSNHVSMKLPPQDLLLYLVLFNSILSDLETLLQDKDPKAIEMMFFLRTEKKPTFMSTKLDVNNCAESFNWTLQDKNNIPRVWRLCRKVWVDVNDCFVEHLSNVTGKITQRLTENNTDIWYASSNINSTSI